MTYNDYGDEVQSSSRDKVFTFGIPATGGSYYLAVDALDHDEAMEKAVQLAKSSHMERASGKPSMMSFYLEDIDSLKVSPEFKDSFYSNGYAFMFTRSRSPDEMDQRTPGRSGYDPTLFRGGGIRYVQ